MAIRKNVRHHAISRKSQISHPRALTRISNFAVLSFMLILGSLLCYGIIMIDFNKVALVDEANVNSYNITHRDSSLRALKPEWGTDYIPIGELNCTALFFNEILEQRKALKFGYNEDSLIQKMRKEQFSCAVMKKLFPFFDEPLSKEEEDFPLAYGMIVHKDVTQILYLLSTIYQPQNQFCIVVDGKSSDEFFRNVNQLSICYPNIYVKRFQPIHWGSFQILDAVHHCLTYLTQLQKPWKYYQYHLNYPRMHNRIQYLSGVDAPLKTNLEMVRIFKALNGSMNAEVLPFDRYRLKQTDFHKSPLRLIKTSLSATFSRETAHVMINDQKAQQLLDYLSQTAIADESFWASVAGNPNQLKVPGGFDGNKFLLEHFPDTKIIDDQIFNARTRRKSWRRKYVFDNSTFPKEHYNISSYYISRYQQWRMTPGFICYGKWSSQSCVYGIRDLPNLVRRHELIAHKFYLNFRPAAFFCVIHEIRRRSLNPVNFSGEEYQYLPDSPLRAY